MNKTCADCIHYDACKDMYDGIKADFDDKRFIGCCEFFADKSRYIELPCAVGDTVYCIQYCYDIYTRKHKTRIQPKVVDFVFTTPFMAESEGMILKERDFGKTVFLTREDAEQALKGGVE